MMPFLLTSPTGIKIFIFSVCAITEAITHLALCDAHSVIANEVTTWKTKQLIKLYHHITL